MYCSVWVCAVTAIQDVWEYRFTLHSADFMHTVCIRLCVQMCDCIHICVQVCTQPSETCGNIKFTQIWFHAYHLSMPTAIRDPWEYKLAHIWFHTHMYVWVCTRLSKTRGNINSHETLRSDQIGLSEFTYEMQEAFKSDDSLEYINVALCGCLS